MSKKRQKIASSCSCSKTNPNSNLRGRGLKATSLVGLSHLLYHSTSEVQWVLWIPFLAENLHRGLNNSLTRHPSSQGCCMQLMEDGSALGTPTPSCTARKPGRGLVIHCLPPSPPPLHLLHPTGETGNHTHPSQLCEKMYIFSTHSVQYSNKSYHHFLKKTTEHQLQNRTPKLPNPPHPAALILGLLGPTSHQWQVTPTPCYPCLARHRGWPQISGSISCLSTKLLLWF